MKNKMEGNVINPDMNSGWKTKLINLSLLLLFALCQSVWSSVSIWLWDMYDSGNCFINIEKPLSMYEDAIDQLSLGGKLSLYYFSYILR